MVAPSASRGLGLDFYWHDAGDQVQTAESSLRSVFSFFVPSLSYIHEIKFDETAGITITKHTPHIPLLWSIRPSSKNHTFCAFSGAFFSKIGP